MPYKIEVLSQLTNRYFEYKDSKTIEDDLDANHIAIRNFFVNEYYGLKKGGYSKFQLDLKLGIKFYSFMNRQIDFNGIYESNYNFWRYIAIHDIPDIVEDRFGIDDADHFYKKASRVYPFTLYWFINLGWQGSEEETERVLSKMNTDDILQVVERPSKIGINLELYRRIYKKYSEYDIKKVKEIGNSKRTVLRKILVKNTAKLLVYRPEIYPGGIEKYVDMLFEEE